MSETLSFAQLQALTQERSPRIALVLGSGLGEVTRGAHELGRLPFREIPDFPETTIAGHRGSLVLADWAGQRVLIFEGRLHYYEGNPWRTVQLPIRTAHYLGTRILVLTNAAGGIRDDLEPGSLMAIRDHLEWTREYSWRHPGPGMLGQPRKSPYSPRLFDILQTAAKLSKVALHTGSYGMMTGPCYETPAEIRALRSCEVDAVGMSTAREIQLGHDLGMECAAISCITNKAAGLSGNTLNHEEVLHTAQAQAAKLAALLEAFLTLMGSDQPRSDLV